MDLVYLANEIIEGRRLTRNDDLPDDTTIEDIDHFFLDLTTEQKLAREDGKRKGLT